MYRRLGLGVALGLSTLFIAPAQAAGSAVIQVPDDFNPAYSGTRATGHYAVDGSSLHVWTQGKTSTDKVAEYIDMNVPLADVGEPSLDLTTNSGDVPPGFQLVADVDGQGGPDGILVGEPADYGNDWWRSDKAARHTPAAPAAPTTAAWTAGGPPSPTPPWWPSASRSGPASSATTT